MKFFYLFILTIFCLLNASGQYANFSQKRSNWKVFEIVQIDYREFSTLVHLTYTNTSQVGSIINFNEDCYIVDNTTGKNFKLLNSYNLPLVSHNKYGILFEPGEKINFTLEFEKLPNSSFDFDIVETIKGNLIHYIGGIIDSNSTKGNFLDLNSFYGKSPIKEVNFFYKDGSVVEYYLEDGLKVAFLLSYDENYGKYFQANLIIQNLTGRDINLKPENLYCKIELDEVVEGNVLSYEQYLKKVKNRQGWNAFLVGFSESLAAASAGYSASHTNTNSSTVSNSQISVDGISKSVEIGVSGNNVYGIAGKTYTSAYGSAYSYSNTQTKSSTASYSGTDAYWANQNARKNIANFNNQQFEIKKTLSEGYVKLNTIKNETEYQAFFNIEYIKKAKCIEVVIPINGKEYPFIVNF